MIDRFREEIYQSFTQRADAGLDLIDATDRLLEIESPVASSDHRCFAGSSVASTNMLNYGRLNVSRLGQVLICASRKMRNWLQAMRCMGWTVQTIQRPKRRR